jgi:hypothetical protein
MLNDFTYDAKGADILIQIPHSTLNSTLKNEEGPMEGSQWQKKNQNNPELISIS